LAIGFLTGLTAAFLAASTVVFCLAATAAGLEAFEATLAGLGLMVLTPAAGEDLEAASPTLAVDDLEAPVAGDFGFGTEVASCFGIAGRLDTSGVGFGASSAAEETMAFAEKKVVVYIKQCHSGL
jgi:hypothetical protein